MGSCGSNGTSDVKPNQYTNLEYWTEPRRNLNAQTMFVRRQQELNSSHSIFAWPKYNYWVLTKANPWNLINFPYLTKTPFLVGFTTWNYNTEQCQFFWKLIKQYWFCIIWTLLHWSTLNFQAVFFQNKPKTFARLLVE